MDELERELMMLELQEMADEYDQERANDLSLRPQWWNINLGLIDSTPEQQKQAKKIFREFMSFPEKPEESLFERFKRFEQFKLFNGGN